MTARALHLAKAFGRFWWDFLVGDTPEVLVSALVLVGLAFALSDDPMAATFTLPAVAAGLLWASARRGRPKEAPAPPGVPESTGGPGWPP